MDYVVIAYVCLAYIVMARLLMAGATQLNHGALSALQHISYCILVIAY